MPEVAVFPSSKRAAPLVAPAEVPSGPHRVRGHVQARKRKRSNRRVVIQGRPALVAVAEGVGVCGRLLMALIRVLGKLLVLASLMAIVVGGGKLAAEHVMASPRFALSSVTVSPTARITEEEVVSLAAVERGERLLALDTDAVAARVAEHPWVAEARVNRQLPSSLHIAITERQAAAVAVLGALYLLDPTGKPFKRATMEEADGLPVFTGIERSQYVDHRVAVEAAYREAMQVLAAWHRLPAGAKPRPALGEVNLSPRYGLTLFLREGAAEIRLGRGDYDRKLARLDQIFEAVRASGADAGAVRVVHLDSDNPTKIPVRLSVPTDPDPKDLL